MYLRKHVELHDTKLFCFMWGPRTNSAWRFMRQPRASSDTLVVVPLMLIPPTSAKIYQNYTVPPNLMDIMSQCSVRGGKKNAVQFFAAVIQNIHLLLLYFSAKDSCCNLHTIK